MVTPTDDLLWYKDAIIYELHVRAFRDSNGDGIGDFQGLKEKLEYVKDLGVTAIWLLPFYPSPGRDDGYDIADYRSINPNYGTMRDFRAVMREADRLGLRVINELVINHTSDQHEWFQRARRAPAGSSARDFYVWSDVPDKYSEARIIFQDFETSNWSWDPVANSYFWHRFYTNQPDLNFDNPQVQRAVISVLDYWMKMGIAGMRLDAVPYLFEREGTNCENLPETHDFLKKLRKHVDTNFPGRMLLSEANQWPEDAVAYFGDDEEGESHVAFHFPLMPRLFMSLQMEDSSPIIDILEQTPPIPEKSQWAIFLRNHDELTLEMVTDEERDYMYRMYAHDRNMRVNLGIRRRLAPLMNNDRRKIELMNGLLFSLPGTPVLYYGDEIGMGDNFYLGDRNAVRTPMQWNSDRNAGFSSTNSQQLYLPPVIDAEYHYEAVNVEAQARNPDSLLWWMKRIIALRKRHLAFSRGEISFLRTSTSKVLAFVRKHGDEEILVTANMSRFPQHVVLEEESLIGKTPVEMFGSGTFPTFTEQPYALSLAPYGFYWFKLEPQTEEELAEQPLPESELNLVSLRARSWETVFNGDVPAGLMDAISEFVTARRWFGGKSRVIRSIDLQHTVPVRVQGGTVHALFIDVSYTEGERETYFLPVALDVLGDATSEDRQLTQPSICRLRFGSGDSAVEGVLYDALEAPEFASAILTAIGARRSFRNRDGAQLTATPVRGFRSMRAGVDRNAVPRRLAVEQSNTSVLIDNKLMFKFYRKVAPGVNPDFEIGRYLTEDVNFPNTSKVGGTVDLVTGPRGNQRSSVGILQAFVEASSDAWQFTLDSLRNYCERAEVSVADREMPQLPNAHILDLVDEEPPQAAVDLIGPYLESARLLGQRTAELHEALGKGTTTDFAPESFTRLYQRSLYQGMRGSVRSTLRSLQAKARSLPDETKALVAEVSASEESLLAKLEGLLDHRMEAKRIRIHGDYHLGQVLYTGTDFVIIDFEGEPARPLTERRIKRSPMRDVAGMVRSFHYAASIALLEGVDGAAEPELWEARQTAANLWYSWVSATFLKGYRDAIVTEGLVPADHADFKVLLDAYLIQKAVYEVGYELNNRPQWLTVPVNGLKSIIESA